MNKKFFIIILSLFFCISFYTTTNAAEMFLNTDMNEMGVGQEFDLNVYFDSENERINTIAGEISISQDKFSFLDINDSNSLVTLWVEKPIYESGKIKFAGIITGGIEHERGNVFSIKLKTKQIGDSIINFNNITILKHDGKGTEARVLYKPLEINVRDGIEIFKVQSEKDTNPPLDFSIQLTQDQNLFDNKWVAIFSTKDKESGLDYFEIFESREPYKNLEKIQDWETVVSPYILKDQTRSSYVYIKAVDRQGNEKISQALPVETQEWWEDYLYWFIIIIAFILIIIIRRYQNKLRKQLN